MEPFVDAFSKYGFWGLLALVFVIYGMKHVAPIIAAIGTIFNDRQKAKLAHIRSMKKIDNKKSPNITETKK